MESHLTLTDRARAILLLVTVALLAAVLAMAGTPIAAQDTFPTPVGRLGGREPLSTAEAVAIELPPQGTPAPVPVAAALAGTWLLDFDDEDRPAARLILSADGTAAFLDGDGNRGAGAWTASGSRRVLLIVAIHETVPPGEAPYLALLQGALEAGASDDVATLDYTASHVEDSGRSAAPAGPFRATALRASG